MQESWSSEEYMPVLLQLSLRPKHSPIAGALAVLLAVCGVTSAGAQSYPSRNVTIIVPFPAGGLVDAAARLLQPELEKTLGRPVVIDNRGGAAGVVGTAAVAKAEPDGHTLLMVASTHTVTPAINPSLPYDTERDFAPITIMARDPLLFVVSNSVAARTLPEFVAAAKAEPGKLNYATPGFGSQAQFVTELLSQRAGIKMQHVPYRGGAPAVIAMVTGDTQFSVLSAQVSLPQIEAGAIRAVAVGSLTRNARLPDVPTVAESGFPGFEAVQWVGVLAPRSTPREIIDRLNGAVAEALKDPSVAARITSQGMSPAGSTPEEFQKLIAAEVKQWKEVAKAAGIKPE
jgi:tripartite-type tricarboxylate transporter receptor subunit TctC